MVARNQNNEDDNETINCFKTLSLMLVEFFLTRRILQMELKFWEIWKLIFWDLEKLKIKD